MIDFYIHNLIQELPSRCKPKKNTAFDVVLEGGLFNGSYLAGCMAYLKELEKQGYIQINRLSGCSIGAFLCLFYFMDENSLILKLYKIAYTQFKEKQNVNVFDKVFQLIRQHLPTNIIQRIQKRLYISYYNIQTGKRVVRNTYKNIEQVFETIRRSCAFPYVIDHQLYYKDKYVDGLYPHIFTNTTTNNSSGQVLYLTIHHLTQIPRMISVKNEQSNLHRILEGAIDIHVFFLHKSKTTICSYIDNWNILDWIRFYLFMYSIEIIIWTLHKIYCIQRWINEYVDDKGFHLLQMTKEMYIHILRSYCI